MAYNELGIVNLALGRLGVAKLTSAQWATPTTVQQAIDAYAVWEYIRDEVLEAKEWRFAKTRATLERAITTPDYTFDYAYVIPQDFLKLCKGTVLDPAVYPLFGTEYKFENLNIPTGAEKVTTGNFSLGTAWTAGAQWTIAAGVAVKAAGGVTTLSQAVASMVSVPVANELYLVQFDVDAISGGFLTPSIGGESGMPVYDTGTQKQYIRALNATGALTFTPSAVAMTCTIDDVSVFKVVDRLCLLTNYVDSTSSPLYIQFIKRVIDPTKYTGSFVNALAWRLAAELAVTRTESGQKFQFCMEMYQKTLLQAEGLNASLDYLEDEQGSDSWETAGR